MKKLKISHKALMIIEASFIYCNRHNLNYDNFIDDVFMTEEFDSSENSEFDNICNDLRHYRQSDTYKLKEISIQEYDACVDRFNNKRYEITIIYQKQTGDTYEDITDGTVINTFDLESPPSKKQVIELFETGQFDISPKDDLHYDRMWFGATISFKGYSVDVIDVKEPYIIEDNHHWNDDFTEWKQPPVKIKHGDLVDVKLENYPGLQLGRYIGKGKGAVVFNNYSKGDSFHVGYVMNRGLDLNPKLISDEKLFEYIED